MQLNAVKDFKVLFVGDAIYDRYQFCSVAGKSMKEPTLSVVLERDETYRGGVWAAANHLTDFCAQVDVWHGGAVMTNTRLVESVYNRKLITTHESRELLNDFHPQIRDYDVVVVCDFGHGAMTPELIERVSREARFLAVNAQTSATNFGFNLITKYKRADYVVLDELEARLATHDKDRPIEDVILELGFKKIAITMGAKGAVGFDGEFYRAPAVADKIVDTMGAGDAFLAVSAPYAAAMFGMKDLVRIGNAAGAAKVEVLGHRGHVTREALERHL